MQVRTRQHETVDQVCYRVLGRTQGVVEATLLLNPGLAAKGPFLPAGELVTLATTPPAPAKLVQLWD